MFKVRGSLEHYLKSCPHVCPQDPESADAKAFEKAAEAIDDIPFATTADDAVYSKFEVSKDSVVLFKKVISTFFFFYFSSPPPPESLIF